MRIALTVDPISEPLTGIGRYTLELLRFLRAKDSRLTLLRHNRIADSLDQATAAWSEANTSSARRDFEALAVKVARVSPLAALMSHWAIERRTNNLGRLLDADLIHGTNYYVPNIKNALKVVTVHDLSFVKCPEWHQLGRATRLRRSMEQAMERADRIITVSEAIRKEVVDCYGCSPDYVVAIPNGIGAEFRPRAESETAGELASLGLQYGSYTLCVATLEPRKNQERLIEAYGQLPELLRAEYPLVLAGAKGWKCQKTVEATASGVGDGWIKYLAYVPEGLLPKLYSGARLVAYPSLYEGFGFPVAEGMASGVPVLASADPALVETSGGLAFYVDPLNIKDIQRGLEAALCDGNWRSSAVDAGIGFARRFTWTDCVARTEEVYLEVGRRKGWDGIGNRQSRQTGF